MTTDCLRHQFIDRALYLLQLGWRDTSGLTLDGRTAPRVDVVSHQHHPAKDQVTPAEHFCILSQGATYLFHLRLRQVSGTAVR